MGSFEQQSHYTLFTGIRFARHMQAPDPAVLWLEEGSVLRDILKQRADLSGLTFCAAGDAPELLELARRANCELTITDLSLLTLYDRMAAKLQLHQTWEKQLLAAAGHSGEKLADCTAALAGGMLFILNADTLQVICTGGYIKTENPIVHGMLDHGRLFVSFFEQLSEQLDKTLCTCPAEGGGCFYAGTVDADKKLYLLLYTPEQKPTEESRLLLNLAQNALSISAQPQKADKPTRELHEIWDDIVQRKLVRDEDISRALAGLPHVPQKFVSIMLIEFAPKRILPNMQSALMKWLENTFPGCNMTIYDKMILLLISDGARKFQPHPDLDYAELQATLEHYDAYAAISNATSRRDMMRTNYLLTHSTLQLGKALRTNSCQRIFLFEEFAEYLSIDLCINSFSALMNHDDIIYLTHPDAVKLYRYDSVHQSNLLDVLYHYCVNSGNISIASKACYMHRNTFSAKLTLLMELIRADLSNGEIRQRMIFSYKVLRYYEKYAKINLGKRFEVSPS